MMRMSRIACASAIRFSSSTLLVRMKLFAMTISRHNLLRHSSSSQHHHPHHHHAAGAVSYLTAATSGSGSSSRKNSNTRSYSHSKRTPEPAAAVAPPPTPRQYSSSSALSSNRGRAAVTLLPSYLADARAVERYSPSNPNGALQLGVAESQLLEDWLVPALNDRSSTSSKEQDGSAPQQQALHADAIYYQPTPGRAELRTAFATYAQELCGLTPGRLDPDGFVVGAGCNAVLENLCFCLADAGDAILIPTPYYAAFEFDCGARAALQVEAVTTEAYHPPPAELQKEEEEAGDSSEDASSTTSSTVSNSSSSDNDSDDSSSFLLDPTVYYPNRAALDAAYERAAAKGHPPKILLLSHPMNPLGICYPADTVRECIDWCRERKVHLIADEIYAGSVHSPSAADNSRADTGFRSVLSLAGPDALGPYVHWVYALSKDFALSGLRVGASYSENPEIRQPLQKLNDLCQISSQTQVWTARTLERRMKSGSSDGEKWVTACRRVHHERLRERSAAVTAVLDRYRIPYLPPTAGLFVWMDLSQFLPDDDTPQRERALYLELVREFGLLLTPGESMRHERPGFFRCVFTAASDEEFAVAVARLERFGRTKRGQQ